MDKLLFTFISTDLKKVSENKKFSNLFLFEKKEKSFEKKDRVSVYQSIIFSRNSQFSQFPHAKQERGMSILKVMRKKNQNKKKKF